jgi:hypothetical protein
MSSNHVSKLRAGMRQNPLDEVVSILIAGNVDERDARSIDAALRDSVQIATDEFISSNLQTLLNYLGSKLIRTVLSSVSNDVINGPAAVCRSSVLTNVLDAPVAELTVGDNVNVCQDLFNARALDNTLAMTFLTDSSWYQTHFVLLQAVLENVLHHKATSLAQGNLMPHASKSLIDKFHDLRRRLGPTQLEELLPDMAGVAVNNRLGDAAEKLVDHDGLVVLRH